MQGTKHPPLYIILALPPKHPETVIEATLTKLFFLFTHFSNSEWNAADASGRKRPWVVRFVTRTRSKTRSIIAVAVVNLLKRTQCTAVKLHLECGYSRKRENNQTHPCSFKAAALIETFTLCTSCLVSLCTFVCILKLQVSYYRSSL